MEQGEKPVDRARRGFLRGRMRPTAAPIRPPWTDEARLTARCLRCSDCIAACPEKIIKKGEGGFPEIAIAAPGAGCTFCGACAEACTAAVFDPALSPPWSVSAVLDEASCLAQAGVHCESCRDTCPEDAISFRPRIGAPPAPRIVAARCTGCGACLGSCPGAALALRLPEPAEVTA